MLLNSFEQTSFRHNGGLYQSEFICLTVLKPGANHHIGGPKQPRTFKLFGGIEDGGAIENSTPSIMVDIITILDAE